LSPSKRQWLLPRDGGKRSASGLNEKAEAPQIARRRGERDFDCSPYPERRKLMARASDALTGKPLIESDRVEGTTVYDPQGNNIGTIKRLMIEKLSGRVAYAIMSFGGFLGMGTEEHGSDPRRW
jgi:PRC-barrel domain